jgi:hypothetical protein
MHPVPLFIRKIRELCHSFMGRISLSPEIMQPTDVLLFIRSSRHTGIALYLLPANQAHNGRNTNDSLITALETHQLHYLQNHHDLRAQASNVSYQELS